MSGVAKAAVMIYLKKELRREPEQSILYESKVGADFVCTVRVEGVERMVRRYRFWYVKEKVRTCCLRRNFVRHDPRWPYH